MPYVPPWLDVSPRDFVQAAAAGGRLGAELAQMANERGIADARNATALQEAQMRENTALSGQQAEAGLANARLEQAAKQNQAEQLLRQWEVQQQIKRQQEAIAAENFRNQNTVQAENDRAAKALDERTKYGQGMLDVRTEANRIAQERANIAANKPSAQDFTTVSEHTPGSPAHSQFTINNPGKPSSFFGLKGGTPPSTLTTTNADDLIGLPPGATISTNKIPAVPSVTTTRRIPVASQAPQRITIQDPNGKKFTIPEDQLQDAVDQGYTQVQ